MVNIGEKLKELRIQRNLTQEELADRCELSKGFISQVERDLASPSIATLTDMLECLGSSLKEFFSDDSAEKVVYAPQDMFEKEEEDKKTRRVIRQERFAGTSQRTFYVGDVRPEEVKCKYESGVLTVLIPKEEPKKLTSSSKIAIE